MLGNIVIALGQSNRFFSYQAIARNEKNEIQKTPISLEINILSGSSSGASVYQERHLNVQPKEGLFTLAIGSRNPNEFAKIDWGKNRYFIKVSVDFSGGSDFSQDIGINEILAVPYALHAETASKVPVFGGKGITIRNDTILNTGDPNAADDVTLNTETKQGDLSGRFNDLRIKPGVINSEKIADEAIDPGKISGMGAQVGQVLKWVDGTWKPSEDRIAAPGISVTPQFGAGEGININNYIITNTGDTDSTDDLTIKTIFQGDVSGPYNNLRIKNNSIGSQHIIDGSIQKEDLSSMGAQQGDILHWDGQSWAPTRSTKFNGLWKKNNDGIYYDGGAVSIEDSLGNKLIEMGKLRLPNGEKSTSGMILGYNGRGKVNWGLQSEVGNEDLGVIAVYGKEGYTPYPPASMRALPNGSGGFFIGYNDKDGKGNLSASMATYPNDPNRGLIQLYYQQKLVTLLGSNEEGSGVIETYGPNGKLNVSISSLKSRPDHGWVAVHDANGTPKAGMFVDSTGQGIVFANVNLVRFDHPDKPELEIWHGTMKGAEVAVYERGTGNLSNGEVFIPYPDHFSQIIDPNTITIQLSPQSAETYGLAVVEKTRLGFRVKELRQGKGNFAFDWEAKAIQAGQKDFKVIHEKAELEKAYRSTDREKLDRTPNVADKKE